MAAISTSSGSPETTISLPRATISARRPASNWRILWSFLPQNAKKLTRVQDNGLLS